MINTRCAQGTKISKFCKLRAFVVKAVDKTPAALKNTKNSNLRALCALVFNLVALSLPQGTRRLCRARFFVAIRLNRMRSVATKNTKNHQKADMRLLNLFCTTIHPLLVFSVRFLPQPFTQQRLIREFFDKIITDKIMNNLPLEHILFNLSHN